MARLEGNVEEIRRSSMKGNFVVYVRNGTMIMAKWPKKRTKPLSKKQAAAVEKFRQASLATKYMLGQEVAASREWAKETNALPRDFLLMALYGRLGVCCLLDGRKFYPMGARNDVSELLDVFGQTFGSLLFRNTEYWAAITPGEETQVLTIGPDGKPAWLPSTGGSSTPGGFACSNPSVLSSSAFAAKGTLIKPQVDLLIPSFVLGFTEVSGATYKVQAWHTDAFQLDELLAESDELTGSYDGFIYRKFSFTTPAALPAGQLNVFLLIRTDATSTTPVGLWTQSADPVSMPVYQTDNYVRLASIDPQVGDFLDHGATGFAYGATFSL